MIRSKSTFLLCTVVAVSALQFGCRHKQQCTGAATPAQPVAPAPAASVAPVAPAPAPTPLTEEQLATRYGECWGFFNDKKWDDFSNCYTEDAVSSRGSFPPDLFKGRAQIVEKDAKPFATAFSDVKGERQLTLVNGSHIASIALITAPTTGRWTWEWVRPSPQPARRRGT